MHSPTWLSHSAALLSRRLWVCTLGLKESLVTPHLLTISGRIQFALCCFHSLLLTVSQLVSFPAGTKTFPFPALLDITVLVVKSHSGIFGSTLTCSSPKHNVACHTLLHQYEPSPPPNSVFSILNTHHLDAYYTMHGFINVKKYLVYFQSLPEVKNPVDELSYTI